MRDASILASPRGLHAPPAERVSRRFGCGGGVKCPVSDHRSRKLAYVEIGAGGSDFANGSSTVVWIVSRAARAVIAVAIYSSSRATPRNLRSTADLRSGLQAIELRHGSQFRARFPSAAGRGPCVGWRLCMDCESKPLCLVRAEGFLKHPAESAR
jgi:hypothetical protein